jgi:hypothetical protein
MGECMYTSASVDRLLAPSVETIAAGCDALKDAAEDVGAAGRSILETCRKVSDVMKALGFNGPSEGSSFGAVSIAIKAVVATASKYVDTKTGVSLRQWADFVSTAQARFDDYLGQLDKVADIATRDEASGLALDLDRLRTDKRIIEDAQFQTKVWRPIMNRLPQMSHLVEAILASKKDKTVNAEPAEEKAGWRSMVKEVVDDVKGRVADEHAELLRSLLGPVTDLRHRISTLHRDVDAMSECMFEFEDLLELQRAQIQMLLGEIESRQMEILAQRLTVAIVVPRLKKRLAASRQRVAEYRSFLQKLEAVRPNAGLSEKVYSTLAAEYRAGLESAMASVRCAEEEIAGWRARGRLVLDANQIWLVEEREAITAREMVGQIPGDQARDLLAGIGRELRRTEAARWLVAE